jgi:hypothetical protein
MEAPMVGRRPWDSKLLVSAKAVLCCVRFDSEMAFVGVMPAMWVTELGITLPVWT